MVVKVVQELAVYFGKIDGKNDTMVTWNLNDRLARGEGKHENIDTLR